MILNVMFESALNLTIMSRNNMKIIFQYIFQHLIHARHFGFNIFFIGIKHLYQCCFHKCEGVGVYFTLTIRKCRAYQNMHSIHNYYCYYY